MPNPAEDTLSHAVSRLRGEIRSAPVGSDEPIVEGVTLSWDTEEGDVTVEVTCTADNLLAVSAEVRKAPRWFSLNLDLGRFVLDPGDVLGLVSESSSDQTGTLHMFVRSATDQRFDDTYLREPLPLTFGRKTNCIMHTVDVDEPWIGEPMYHCLVVPLPLNSFRLTLFDLRMFLLPQKRVPGQGEATVPATA